MASLNFNSPTMLTEIYASHVLSSNSYKTLSPDEQRLFNHDILYHLWIRLKEKIAHGALNFSIYAEKIEAKYNFSTVFPSEESISKTTLLFKELAKKFFDAFKEAGLEALVKDRIPVAYIEYQSLQEILKKKWEDEALCTFWNQEIFRQLGETPRLETPEAIRLWMNDPSNAPLLAPISEITISHQNLKTIPPEITKLIGLTQLTLSNNAIVLIDALSLCPQLEYIDLEKNKISSCEPLKNCTKCICIRLSHNLISDVSALSGLAELIEVQLDENMISEIAPLSELTKLQVLTLSINRISTIDPLAKLNQLRILDLGSNSISEIGAIANCVWIETLILNNNYIKETTPLQTCILMQTLNLKCNQISEIDALSSLEQLHTLCLDGNRIQRIDALSACRQLVDVEINDNEISTLDPLASPELCQLSAINNRISSIDFFAGHPKLQTLCLGMNEISRIDSLAAYTKLKHLDLQRNKISEFAPLVNLPLRKLCLQSNPIPTSNPMEYFKKLKNIAKQNCLYLFPIETDIAEIQPIGFKEKERAFSQYTCSAITSLFIKKIALQALSPQEMQQAFDELEDGDQSLIKSAVCKEWVFLGKPRTLLDAPERLSTDLLFSNQSLLQRAVRKAMMSKFEGMSEKSKMQVYREIYTIVHISQDAWEEPYAAEERDEIDKILWGKKHVFDSLLVLVDAMQRIPPNL